MKPMTKENKHYNVDGHSAEDRALDKFAELMIEKLETIQSDWKKPWFTKGAFVALPKNLSGREYNGMNSLMLMMQAEKHGYELPVWCTFDRVTGLNFTKDKQGERTQTRDSEGNTLPRVAVNKGEKSFPVFITTFTCVDSETKERIKYDDYKKLSEEERARYNVYPKLQVYNVFNVAQTNIREARPELYQKLLEQNTQQKVPEVQEGEQFSFPAIDHMIAHNEWICPIKPTYGDDAYYSISKAEIVIPEKKQFKSGESFYANLAHEMAHSTGAEQYLNRLQPTSFGSKEYAREELVAELTAALTSQRYGMSKVIKEDSVPYLKNWLDSLKEEPSYIKNVLQDVKRASSMINQYVDKVQLQLDDGVEVSQDETQKESISYGSYDIPKWALPYILNGDTSGISDRELELIDTFLDHHFPEGFIPEVEEGKDKELNLYPAFGEKNENAITDKGESPFLAVETVSVRFESPGYFEVRSEEPSGYATEVVTDNTQDIHAAKDVPQQQEQEEEEDVHYHRGR
jgi:antirestriction protein ArdC